MSRELMQQALEALDAYSWEQVQAATTALRERLAQPEMNQWQGLTDEDMEALFLNEDGVRFARYIEAKLKEKNT